MKSYPFRSPLFQSQFLRTLGKVYYRGADVGECYAVADRIREGQGLSWYDNWSRLATVCQERGKEFLDQSQQQSAMQEFLRASEYHRQACFFLRDNLGERRLRSASEAMRRCFGEALALMSYPSTTVELFHEGITLRGYFLEPNANKGEERPTIINLSGYDSAAEELFCIGGTAALERGYNCFNIDGPGQGSLLWERGYLMRDDAEKFVELALRWLHKQPSVDKKRIVLIGRSLAGYLATRAATRLQGFAALVVNPLMVNLKQTALKMAPSLCSSLYRNNCRSLLDFATRQFLKISYDKQFFFQSRYACHGVSNISAYIDALEDYRCDAEMDKISCPVVICESDSDPFAASCNKLSINAITTPTYRLSFTTAEGTGGHCTPVGHALFYEKVFNTLYGILQTSAVNV